MIFNPQNIPINQKQEASGLKILILNSGRLQISRHISLVATYPTARTLKTSRNISHVATYPNGTEATETLKIKS
ncbi:unknown [Prevotella sp. CAG:1185]|nr:unknown [Prevotella sp. CAG:1185]